MRASARVDRILVVEDDPASREALAALLRDHGYVVDTAKDGAEAIAIIDREPPSVVITDIQMPHGGGFGIVRHMRSRPGLVGVPIILITALEGRRRNAGLDLGADDYLAKPIDFDELLARLRVQLRHAHLQRDLIRNAELDPLTGVLNRRGILAVLRHERERVERSNGALSIALVDVDRFKRINDVYGHAAGDSVLRRVAQALVGAARAADLVGRLGGDELVVVLPDTDQAGALAAAERIGAIRIPLAGEVDEDAVTVSVGVATRHRGETVDALLARADQAMYAAKHRRQLARDGTRDASS